MKGARLMQNEFNVVLNSFHSVSIVLPHIGDIQLPAKQDVLSIIIYR